MILNFWEKMCQYPHTHIFFKSDPDFITIFYAQ